jgi:hypothetical protein
MDIGVIAVIASVLVLAVQAREFAKHTRVANEAAEVETHRDLMAMYGAVHRVFIDHPELWPHYYDQSSVAPSAHDQVRLRVVSEMAADAHEVAWDTVDELTSYKRYAEPWREYVRAEVGKSSTLRSFVRDQLTGWPSLTSLVAAYDARSPAPATHEPSAEPPT